MNRKRLNSIKLLSLLALAITLFAGCTKTDLEEELLYGTWYCAEYEGGFYYIVHVVSEGYLVAAEFFCLGIQMPPPHSRAQITRRFCRRGVRCRKYVTFKRR